MTTMPSHNAEGHQVWNPSVGKYFKPSARQRESYGGIVGALNDQIASQGSVNKAYPHNFAGIIAAIEDLTFTQKEEPVKPGVRPPGGDVIIDSEGNPEWIWATEPRDGELWYDTRQGRLFIAWEGEYYQTNGADGLAQVTDDSVAPTTPVIGQFWWDLSTKNLYIFDGFWFDEDGDVKGTHEPGYTPVWRVVTEGSSASTFTTDTLPLLITEDSVIKSNPAGNILPDLSIPQMHVQSDYNEWIYSSLEALEYAIESEDPVQVHMGTTAPAAPKQGDLWYDTSNLDLSVYYKDDNTSQWVSTNVNYNYDAQINILESLITTERSERINSDASLSSTISNTVANSSLVQELQTKLTTVELEIAVRPVIDTALFNTVESAYALTQRVSTLETTAPDYSSVQSKADALTQYEALNATVATLATSTELDVVNASIPSIAGLATTTDVAEAIANITVEYLPRTGGTLSGAFISEKQDMSKPTFDFSGKKWYGYNTHKYLTNALTPSYATFGTNENYNEYAWNFTANEDFCWVYNDSNKVFSITKDGPACSTLYLADFYDNNENGRVITNKIDVRERLLKYQSAFEQMRQGVNNSSDFSSLKENILSSLALI